VQGKTYLIAIFCIVRCILFPGTRICISSKSRPQATEVIDKIITILMPNSANLRLEIKDWVSNNTNAFINFKNSSRITVVTANDAARHNRANILVIDEFRMVDLNIINTVLRKFLTSPRQPKYLDKPEY
jgi:phage terminase large subunit-like protein